MEKLQATSDTVSVVARHHPLSAPSEDSDGFLCLEVALRLLIPYQNSVSHFGCKG